MSAGCVLTIGNFDGVHLGHQKILQEASFEATRRGLPLVVMTFIPHPRVVLRPAEALELIQTYAERRMAILAIVPKAQFLEQEFEPTFAALDGPTFLNTIVRDKLHAQHVVVGFDFCFGRAKSGNRDVLSAFCASHGMGITLVPELLVEGVRVSSSAIRTAIHAGDVERARSLLGRNFDAHGIVIRGDGRGSQIGIPTANLELEPKLMVASGVYASLLNGRPSVTNVGVRPTFPGATPAVETHVLDFSGDLYGSRVSLEFLARIRAEKKFGSVTELVAQIRCDIASVRGLLG